MIPRMQHALWASLGVVWASLSWAVAAQPHPAPFVDAHSHYTAADVRALGPAAIVKKLDEAGVSRVAISGTPGALAQELHAHAPQRIIPFLGVYGSDADKATWMRDRSLPARVAAQLRSGTWAGLGELHLFAQDAHSEVFAELVRLAAQHGLVLLLHGDAEVVDRAFELEPGLRVLWAHLGTQPLPDTVAAVLQRHDQRALWIDTSVRDDRIAPSGQLLPEWRALFEAHPHRFVVAIDAFSTQRWGRYAQVAGHIRQWTQPLPPELRELLLRGNAEALFAPWTRR